MQLRESGLRGLQQAAAQLQPSALGRGGRCDPRSRRSRLIAGTVVYDDLFKARSEEVLRQEGITGVAVPESPFLTDTAMLDGGLAERSRQAHHAGWRPTAETGGLHGNQIVSAFASSPEARSSRPIEENTIVATEDFSIVVARRNSGDFQETEVQVTRRLQAGTEISKSKPIPSINAGARPRK